jgi:4-amino-4-deoxy-L-arabinose transferase-like glycosyltransferase
MAVRMLDSPPLGTQGRAPLGLVLAVVIGALALYLPGIGAGDFVGDDEALDAGVVWEMARSGDWLFPEFNGEYLPPKPPLFYWVARLSSLATGGVDEWSQRAPSALAAAATIGLTVAGAAPLVGVGPAVLSGVMLATMPVMRGEARIGRCDMLLTLLVTACLMLLARASDPMPRATSWLFWFLLGLVAICKGGAGVGLVVAVLVGLACAERSTAKVRGLVGPSVGAFVVIVGAWYGLASLHWGARFVDEQIVGENLRHLVGGSGISDQGQGTRSLAYHLGFYPRELFLTTFPWGLLLPAALFECWRKRTPSSSRFFVFWLLSGLVFFTLASRKSPYYLLPLSPAVAVLAASWAFPRVHESLATRRFDLGFSALWFVLPLAAAVIGWLSTFVLPSQPCELAAVSTSLGGHPFSSIGCLWLFLVSAALLAQAARQRDWAVGIGATACMIAGAFLIADRIEGPLDACASLKPFAHQIAARTRPTDRIWFFRYPLPAVALYTERRIPTLRDPATASPTRPFYLIVPQSLASEVPASWREPSKTLVRARARVFTRRRMGIELIRVGAPAEESTQLTARAPLMRSNPRD